MQGKNRKRAINCNIAILNKWLLNAKTLYLHELYDRIEEKDLKSQSENAKA